MTGKKIIKPLIDLVKYIINSYSPILIKMAINGIRNKTKYNYIKDNFSYEIDSEINNVYDTKLQSLFSNYIFISEEITPKMYSVKKNLFPEYLIIVDPLDTSDLAVRGLQGYTQLVVYSIKKQYPLASVVGDMFHDLQIFCGYQDDNGIDKAFLITRDGNEYPITSSNETNLNDALITTYSMRPVERFLKISKEVKFLKELSSPDKKGIRRGRLGVDFGSIGLCHVASGFSDGMIEIAKGFYIWDLYPGQYILHASGGSIATLDGKSIGLNLGIRSFKDVQKLPDNRKMFVAAGNRVLLHSMLKILNQQLI